MTIKTEIIETAVGYELNEALDYTAIFDRIPEDITKATNGGDYFSGWKFEFHGHNLVLIRVENMFSQFEEAGSPEIISIDDYDEIFGAVFGNENIIKI